MDYIREMLNAGSRIMDAVNDAVERGDYSNLTKNITDEMSGYTKNVMNDGRQKVNNAKRTYKTYTYNVNPGPRHASGYRPVDIDLGTRPNSAGKRPNQYSQQRPNQGFWGNTGQNYGPGTNTSNAKNAAGQNQNAQSNAGKFTGAKTGAGYNAGQAYDQRRQQQNASWNYSAGRDAGQAQGNANAQQRPKYTGSGTQITPFNQYKKQAGSGLLKQTAGVTGLFITVPVAVATVAAAAATGGLSTILTAAMFGAGAGVSGYFTRKGSRQRKLSKIFDKYSKIVGNAEYMTIEDLANQANEPVDLVQKNLDEMISLGMLPQLKYDQKKTTMMLTKNAYDQYLLAEDSRKEREKREAELDEQAGSATARKVITEGEAFVTKIKKANELIPGEEMTAKLDQMERIVSKIFAQVRKDPSSAEDLRKFMNYYLPTTEKLLNAYIDLDKQPEIGENIPKTKREIEGTVDTINDAFENLLDSLFEEVAWDISSDISVMKTMMEQDGLMKKGMAEAAATAAADVVSDEPIPDVKEALNPKPEGIEKKTEPIDNTSKSNEKTHESNEVKESEEPKANSDENPEGWEPELKFDE